MEKNRSASAIGDSGEDLRLIKTLPRKGFRFVGAVQEERAPAVAAVAATHTEAPRSTLTLPEKPSIAVLPFSSTDAAWH